MNLKKLKRLARTVLLSGALLCSGSLLSQELISGRVVTNDGEPAIGATVIVDGTTTGTSTNINGEFSLRAHTGTPVTISLMGYKSLKTILSPGMVATIEDDATLIEDLVVVGYGSARKETLTGAIAVVGDQMLKEKGSLSSPLQALQGQVPGVIITRSSSAPGDESWGMSLRGSVSRNNSEPLVVIDGVAYESINEMRLLNPSDIESMSFLKDGAAAIYGSRASGGVVLITTKKGKQGRTKVEYNGSVSVKTVGLMPTLMTLDEWSDAVVQTLENDNNTSNIWYSYAKIAKAYKGSYINLQNTASPFPSSNFSDVADFVFDDSVNWLGSIFDNSTSTSHDVSVSGGTEKVSYRLSVGYLYDGSPLQYGNNFNHRYNFRSNTVYKFNDWLRLESVISYNRQEQVKPTNLSSMLTVLVPMPGLPLFTSDGKPYAWGTWESPAALAEYGGDNKLSVSAINISETFKANITRWLDANINVGYNTSNANRHEVANSVGFYNFAGNTKVRTAPTQAQSSYKQTSAQTDFYSFSGYLNGHHSLCSHNFSATLGGQYEYKQYTRLGAMAKDIQDGLENINGSGEISLINETDKKNLNEKYHFAVASLFGRFNYDYDRKYLIEFNMRYDGSSKFLSKNRWDFFWGASAGWRISQEGFLKDAKWLDELKLRASYGEVGNQNGISNYDGVQLYNLNPSSGALVGDGLLSYMATTGTLASNARTWERIKNYNIGLDFGFLRNRLTGSVEGFLKKNDNMLVSISFPSVLGDKAPEANAGKFKAWGYEGQIAWRDKIGQVGYHVGATWTFARNELVDLGGSAVIANGYKDDREGYPLKSLFGLRYAGKIQTQEQLDAYTAKYYNNNGIGMPSNLRLGDHMYEDVNKDGKLDANDYEYLGSDKPEIQYSFSAGIEWKGLEISAIFQGAANRSMWNDINNWAVPMRATYTNTTNQSIGNTWSVNNRSAHFPSYTTDSNINNYNYQASSWSASDASYIRLKNVTVSYNLPSRWFARTDAITGIRVYFTGTDLWERSQINDGWDPEAQSSPGTTARYPFLRSYTFGANLTF